MSWIKRRPFLALTALALTLRVSCAILTEFKPIFPEYYYTDAKMVHSIAARALDDLHAGRTPEIPGPLSLRLQIEATLSVYRAFGPYPLSVKLIYATLGALGATALARALTLICSTSAALAAGVILAIWPSHVFYTSQNLKEAPVALLVYAALGAAATAGLSGEKTLSKSTLYAFIAALSLFGAGCYRSYVLICLAPALLLAFGIAALERHLRANALVATTFLAATLALYPAGSRLLYRISERSPTQIHTGASYPDGASLIPVTVDNFGQGKRNYLTSPQGISLSRKWRQLSSSRLARDDQNREIGTQIYPAVEFKTWGDVLAYLPKGAFTVLFMPLPGLYPMDGKPGRWAAAGENLILLLLAALAALGFARGPKTPARLGILMFFAAMSTGSALLEFDLGSAGRHKLLYLPMLFPFAAEEVLRLRDRRKSAIGSIPQAE